MSGFFKKLMGIADEAEAATSEVNTENAAEEEATVKESPEETLQENEEVIDPDPEENKPEDPDTSENVKQINAFEKVMVGVLMEGRITEIDSEKDKTSVMIDHNSIIVNCPCCRIIEGSDLNIGEKVLIKVCGVKDEGLVGEIVSTQHWLPVEKINEPEQEEVPEEPVSEENASDSVETENEEIQEELSPAESDKAEPDGFDISVKKAQELVFEHNSFAEENCGQPEKDLFEFVMRLSIQSPSHRRDVTKNAISELTDITTEICQNVKAYDDLDESDPARASWEKFMALEENEKLWVSQNLLKALEAFREL